MAWIFDLLATIKTELISAANMPPCGDYKATGPKLCRNLVQAPGNLENLHISSFLDIDVIHKAT